MPLADPTAIPCSAHPPPIRVEPQSSRKQPDAVCHFGTPLPTLHPTVSRRQPNARDECSLDSPMVGNGGQPDPSHYRYASSIPAALRSHSAPLGRHLASKRTGPTSAEAAAVGDGVRSASPPASTGTPGSERLPLSRIVHPPRVESSTPRVELRQLAPDSSPAGIEVKRACPVPFETRLPSDVRRETVRTAFLPSIARCSTTDRYC